MIEFSNDISGFLFIYFDLFVFYVTFITFDHTFSELLEMSPQTAYNKWYFITFFGYSCLKFSLILWYFFTQHLDLSFEEYFQVLKNDLHWLQYCLHRTHAYYPIPHSITYSRPFPICPIYYCCLDCTNSLYYRSRPIKY